MVTSTAVVSLKARVDKASVSSSVNYISQSLQYANKKGFFTLLKSSGEVMNYAKGMKYNLEAVKREIMSITESTRQFNFAFLSFLFTGMMMKQMFGGLFSSLVDNYKKVQDENSYFNNIMSQTSARVQYLKFLFFDAFVNSGVFDFLIDKFFTITDYISNLNDKTKSWSVTLIGVLAVVGTVFMFTGGILQFLELIKTLQIAIVGRWVAFSGANSKVLHVVKTLFGIFLEILGLLWRLVKPIFTFRGALVTLILFLVTNFIRYLVLFRGNWKDALKGTFIDFEIFIGKLLKGALAIAKFFVSIWVIIRNAFTNILISFIKNKLNDLADGFRKLGLFSFADKIQRASDRIKYTSLRFSETTEGKFFESIENYLDRRQDKWLQASKDLLSYYDYYYENGTVKKISFEDFSKKSTQPQTNNINYSIYIDNINVDGGNGYNLTSPDDIKEAHKNAFEDLFKEHNMNASFNVNGG